jgi:hypothetical protein
LSNSCNRGVAAIRGVATRACCIRQELQWCSSELCEIDANGCAQQVPDLWWSDVPLRNTKVSQRRTPSPSLAPIPFPSLSIPVWTHTVSPVSPRGCLGSNTGRVISLSLLYAAHPVALPSPESTLPCLDTYTQPGVLSPSCMCSRWQMWVAVCAAVKCGRVARVCAVHDGGAAVCAAQLCALPSYVRCPDHDTRTL